MEQCHGLANTGDSLFFPTKYKVVNLKDKDAVMEATEWWQEMTRTGGEGMVVSRWPSIALYERFQYFHPAFLSRRFVTTVSRTSPS